MEKNIGGSRPKEHFMEKDLSVDRVRLASQQRAPLCHRELGNIELDLTHWTTQSVKYDPMEEEEGEEEGVVTLK